MKVNDVYTTSYPFYTVKKIKFCTLKIDNPEQSHPTGSCFSHCHAKRIKSLEESKQGRPEVDSPAGPERPGAEQSLTEETWWLPQEGASENELSTGRLTELPEMTWWTPDTSGQDWTKRGPEEKRGDGRLNCSKYRLKRERDTLGSKQVVTTNINHQPHWEWC
ncbi:hypothetical protein Y1Q_0003255 [Alligator mississippiensis]|uniref:Uncharacterized protein n=1 Tax=Alligator mississippiensis TaxID=8496 RepID=A0A151ME39_ALLMI|nr:hypothetical protein Y1Q_0003255 [Alligator mississippiensis]